MSNPLGTVDVDDQMGRIELMVCEIGKISGVGPDEDFYAAGFSSIKALELLLELETACDVSIPDDRFVAARTVRALRDMIAELRREQGQ